MACRRIECPGHYTCVEVGRFLGISPDAVRRRINYGSMPGEKYNNWFRVVSKTEFWAWCAKQESVGLIRRNKMPAEYRAERLLFLGNVNYDDNVMYGKWGT